MAGSEEGLGWGGFLICFGVAVATILGTGILGLPVKLADSGFAPFLPTFAVCLVMQVAVVVLMVEILQRAERPTKPGGPPVVPDLHQLSARFLGPSLRLFFNCLVIVHFVAILISYTLASSEAYAQLFTVVLGTDVHASAMILPLAFAFTLIVLFGGQVLQPVISALTMTKCTLLLVMIAMVGYAGSKVTEPSVSHWSRLLEPYLLGTVALGGVANLMPVTYARVPRTRRAIRSYRTAVVSGVVACWAANIMWCYFVLQIVPQHAEEGREGQSLEEAALDGEISTVPLIRVLDTNFPSLRWIANVVNGFIVLSVSVSFLTIGTGFRHMLEGVVRHRRHKYGLAPYGTPAEAAHGRERGTSFNESLALPEVGEAGAVSGLADAATEDLFDVPLGEGESRSDPESASPTPAAAGEGRGEYKTNGHDAEGEGEEEEEEEDGDDGAVATAAPPLTVARCCRALRQGLFLMTTRRLVLNGVGFSFVALIAQMNPKGFLVMLEVFGSFALNLVSGALIAAMMLFALKNEPAHSPTIDRSAGPTKESVTRRAALLSSAEDDGSSMGAAASGSARGSGRESDSGADTGFTILAPLGEANCARMAWFVVGSFLLAVAYDIAEVAIATVGPYAAACLLPTAIAAAARAWCLLRLRRCLPAVELPYERGHAGSYTSMVTEREPQGGGESPTSAEDGAAFSGAAPLPAWRASRWLAASSAVLVCAGGLAGGPGADTCSLAPSAAWTMALLAAAAVVSADAAHALCRDAHRAWVLGAAAEAVAGLILAVAAIVAAAEGCGGGAGAALLGFVAAAAAAFISRRRAALVLTHGK